MQTIRRSVYVVFLGLILVPAIASAVVVTFPDLNMEAAIRQAISKPAGDILDSDLLGLTTLSANGKGIANISGIEYCVNLTGLQLQGNQIVDVSPLAGLANLTWLQLQGNQIVDVGPLLGNTGLGTGDTINLSNNPLSAQSCTDISILEARGVTVNHDPCVGVGFEFYETPQSGQYRQGDSLTLKVAFVDEVGNAQIQWTKNGVDIPGQISDTFSINSLTVDDTGAYRVRVTDESKAVYVTPPAIITVSEGSPLPLATSLMLLLMLTVIPVAGNAVLRRSH